MINYELQKIRAIIFDVDGVLSSETVSMDAMGEPLRTVNIKDGYAIQLAVKKGIKIVIITGGNTDSIRHRYERLGVEDIFMGCAVKILTYNDFLERHQLSDEQIIFMGDDIPDYEIMKRVGCPCCPADACGEIKAISTYISRFKGGQGCARDVIEQVMKAQGLWLSDAEAFGW